MIDDTPNIFITALGGDLAQSIVKSLRLSRFPLNIVGADTAKDTVASLFAERVYHIPPAEDSSYISCLIKCLVESNSHILIPSSEAEIFAISNYIAKNAINNFPCHVICQEISQLQIFGDKLTCYNYLEKLIEIPQFADGQDLAAVEAFLNHNDFPCIIKGRRTSGSKHMHIVNSKKEFDAKVKITPFPIIQQYIDASYGEYSIGVFVDNAEVHLIPFKRVLGSMGASWLASTAFDQHEIIDFSEKLAQHIEMKGSYNIQLRYGKDGIGLLEVNPRFSSLVAARAAAGFNDALWSVQKVLGMPIAFPERFSDVKFRRFIQEAIDIGQGLECPSEWAPKMMNSWKM